MARTAYSLVQITCTLQRAVWNLGASLRLNVGNELATFIRDGQATKCRMPDGVLVTQGSRIDGGGFDKDLVLCLRIALNGQGQVILPCEIWVQITPNRRRSVIGCLLACMSFQIGVLRCPCTHVMVFGFTQLFSFCM